MNILITGIAGFIGSNAAERFLDLGHNVYGLDCFTDYYAVSQKRLNTAQLQKKGIKVYATDLSKDDLSPIIADADVIFHFAAQPGISATVPFETYLKNNITATQNLLQSASGLETLKMFVNIATSSVYGLHATSTEDEAPKPASYYGVTKLAAEQLVLSAQRSGNINACSTRLFSIYGPRERPDKLFPRLIKSILRDEEYPLFEGSKEHIRSYTYVGDILDGFLKILENLDKVNGEIFNIGTDKTFTTGEAIEMVEDIIGKPAKPKMLPKRPGDQSVTQANIEKAERVLGYEAKTKLYDGLRETVKWYQENINDLPATY